MKMNNMRMKTTLNGQMAILIHLLCMSTAFAACYQGKSCPAGRRSGDSWTENCNDCSCSGLIEEQNLCYLPSQSTKDCVRPVPLHYAPYEIEAGNKFECGPGFKNTTMADLPYIEAKLAILFIARIGGGFQCCSRTYPVFDKNKCKMVKGEDGCTNLAVLKRDPSTPCPKNLVFGAIGR